MADKTLAAFFVQQVGMIGNERRYFDLNRCAQQFLGSGLDHLGQRIRRTYGSGVIFFGQTLCQDIRKDPPCATIVLNSAAVFAPQPSGSRRMDLSAKWRPRDPCQYAS